MVIDILINKHFKLSIWAEDNIIMTICLAALKEHVDFYDSLLC